jgi:hypothetical protein
MGARLAKGLEKSKANPLLAAAGLVFLVVG